MFTVYIIKNNHKKEITKVSNFGYAVQIGKKHLKKGKIIEIKEGDRLVTSYTSKEIA